MRPVLVIGGGLAGLAAALRLAKAGHPVQLWEATDRLGGRYAPDVGPGGLLVDCAPAVIGFPAPWRDLYRKSGRTLEAELARTGAALEPAQPPRYEFADGSALRLPTDRGEQYATLIHAYGQRAATRWQDVLDWLDDVWQAVRPLGLEAELTDRSQVSSAVTRLLRPRLTVARLAEQMPHPALVALIRASAYRMGSTPERTPAWAAVTLSVDRRFGRWTVTAPATDTRVRTGRTSALVEALVDRLAVRKVEVRLQSRVVAITPVGGNVIVRAADGTEAGTSTVVFTGDPWSLPDMVPRSALPATRRDLRRLGAAAAPRVSHRQVDEPVASVQETVRLTAKGVPVITYRRPTPGGGIESVHDFAQGHPERSAGVAWRGFRSWFRRPRISTEVPGLIFAGPQTAAGASLSSTLLAGALASYAAHDRAK